MINKTVALLREYGISPSPQRTAIYTYLLENRTHPTAETIYQEIRKIIPGISLTTIYNTLKLLAEKKALQEVIIEDRELRFDGDTREHAHFKCLQCGGVFDLFPGEGGKIATDMPALPEGFSVSQVHLCLKGLCCCCGKETLSGKK